MGFRFSRRIMLLPGVSVNLSKSGASLSVGPRGAKVTVGPRGVRQTVGIPGTGLYYTTTSSSGRRSTSKAPVLPSAQAVSPPTVEERLTLSFFKRLVTPDDEEDLVAGMKAMVQEDTPTALACFQKCAHLADAAFLAGVLLLKQKDFKSATTYLEVARNSSRELGKYFQKYGLTGSFDVPITAQITAKGQVGVRLLLLILVEAYQAAARYQEAVDVLNQLHQMNPDDLVVKVSRSELLLEAVRTKDAYKQVIQLAAGVGFGSEMEAVLLLYKAEALRQLGLFAPSLEILDSLWGKRSLWNEKLLLAIRFERGCAYEAMGDDRKARTDWEYVYAKNPNYEGVAERLGL